MRPAGLALVGEDDLDLGPRRALDDLGQGARLEGRRVAAAMPSPSASSSVEQALVAKGGHLRGLAEGGPPLALGRAGRARRCR